MALSNLTSLKTFLSTAGVPIAWNDALLQQLLDGTDAVIKNYCKSPLEMDTYTEFKCGSGWRDLVLDHRPVISVTSVYLDSHGYYGDGPGAFAAATLQTAGQDYVLIRDKGQVSKSGIIRRLIGATTFDGEFGWLPVRYSRGSIWARQGPYWPGGSGNIKVVYTAGYEPVPDDLTLACNELATWVYVNRKRGGVPLQSESLSQYSYSVAATSALNSAPELSTTRQILTRYRDLM